MTASDMALAIKRIAWQSSQDQSALPAVSGHVNSFPTADKAVITDLISSLAANTVTAPTVNDGANLVEAASALNASKYATLVTALDALPLATRQAIVALAQQLATVSTT